MAGPRDATKELYPMSDRLNYQSKDMIQEVWNGLGLPSEALGSLDLDGDDSPALPSSFKIGVIAQGSVALSALAAAQFHALRTKAAVARVGVSLQHAVIEFKSERFYTLDGKKPVDRAFDIGGLLKASDGYIRVHDGFPNHANGFLRLMGLPEGATREEVGAKVSNWAPIDLETVAVVDNKLAAYALRTFHQWDAHPQSQAISSFPIDVTRLPSKSPSGLPQRLQDPGSSCLKGVRVIEMSRVIASPVAGRTLAAHGADVIWITSPNLPDLPGTDKDVARGKKTVQLDLDQYEDQETFVKLVKTADVFLQGYRPDASINRRYNPERLISLNPKLVIGNLSAFGPRGPWSQRRGFDSLVQTCSGMNVSEAEHCGKGEPAMPMPCQALDHASGYLLATGIIAALYKRTVEGGAWQVDVSLAGTMKYLRSLGQYPGRSGFEPKDFVTSDDIPSELYEEKPSGFGLLKAIKHSARIEGLDVGWDIMPKPLGSDSPVWS